MQCIQETFPQITGLYAESVINQLAVIARITNELQLRVEWLVEQTDPHCGGKPVAQNVKLNHK